jgi:hypothetical protein
VFADTCVACDPRFHDECLDVKAKYRTLTDVESSLSLSTTFPAVIVLRVWLRTVHEAESVMPPSKCQKNGKTTSVPNNVRSEYDELTDPSSGDSSSGGSYRSEMIVKKLSCTNVECSNSKTHLLTLLVCVKEESDDDPNPHLRNYVSYREYSGELKVR